jgi:hypothetical protein
MKDINDYNLNTKKLLRAVLEMNPVQYSKEIKLYKNELLLKFPRYSDAAHTLPNGAFVSICEHFGLSHDGILNKIVAYHGVSDKVEIERIARWMNLDLTINKIRNQFGGDNFKFP